MRYTGGMDWYDALIKPALNPPSWIFSPVWTVLYIMMAVSAFLVWKKGWKRKEVRLALAMFGVQLALNLIWSPLFFGLQNPLLALVDIIVMLAAIIWTIILFYKLSRPAAYLLIPYFLWVSFATYLNFSIWWLN